MACKFSYKGLKTFNNEYELDSYLLKNSDLIEKYKDIVFERPDVINNKIKFFDGEDKVIIDLYKTGKITRVWLPNDFIDIDEVVGKDGYIGVTKFLLTLKNTESEKSEFIAPIFHEDDFLDETTGEWKKGYWSHKIEEWKKADPESLSESDKEVMFDTDDTGKYIITPITDTMIAKAKERYLKKWLTLAILGTCIHEVFHLFFKGDETGNSFRGYRSAEAVSSRIYNELKKIKTRVSKEEDKTKPGYKEMAMSDILSDKKVTDIVKLCLKLNEEITSKFGKNSVCLTEKNIMGDAIIDGEKQIVVGRLDLVVIDDKGNMHLIDYKTSPKNYYLEGENGYDPAKIRTFMYQLGTYRKLISYNLKQSCQVYVIPILLKDYHLQGKGTDDEFFDYDKLAINDSSFLVNLTPQILGDRSVTKNLDRVFPHDVCYDYSSDDIGGMVYNWVCKWFPNYKDTKTYSIEYVTKLLNDRKVFDKKRDTYLYTVGNKVIKGKSETELVEKVKAELEYQRNNISILTSNVAEQLLTAQNENLGDDFEFSWGEYSKASTKDTSDPEWLNRQLSRYATSRYKVLNAENTEKFPSILNNLGILLIENQYTHTIHAIKISLNNLTEEYQFGDNVQNHNITGNYESDIVSSNKPNSLVLKAYKGNIELMETMLALNQLGALFSLHDFLLGSIEVINPKTLHGMTASNKQLLYNFELLSLLSGFNGSLYSAYDSENKPIHMMTTVEIVKEGFNNVVLDANNNPDIRRLQVWKHKYSESTSELDNDTGNSVKLRAHLLSLAKKLEKSFPSLKSYNTSKYQENAEPLYALYRDIMYAISELDGYDYTLLVKDHDKYIDSLTLANLGHSGTFLDNAGNQQSATLNKANKAIFTAYLNLRDDVLRFYEELQEKVKKLKDAKHLTWVHTHLLGELDYYANLTYIDEDTGDLMFKQVDDASLSAEEKEFLTYALAKINARRYPKEMEDGTLNDTLARQVPLTLGGSDSRRLSSGGFLGAIKSKLQTLNPVTWVKNWYARAKERLNTITSEDAKKLMNEGALWEMTNTFDAGLNQKTRMEMINDTAKGGVMRFERNIETLLLKHEFAYMQKEELDKVFPVVKTAMIHLLTGGMFINEKAFSDDIEYLYKYIRSKVFNLSIVDPNKQWMQAFNQEIMQKASKLALAFSPHLFYLALDGIWKDIAIVYRLNGNNDHFSAADMKDAFFETYRDLMHIEPSVSMKVNDLYGINDRDMNVYITRIKSDQGLFTNMSDAAFKFAAGPDYYNRMTLFGALMRHDGSWEAHRIVNGKLVYDWTLDKRFDIYAKYADKEDTLPTELKDKFNKLKALYIAMALQFMLEHAHNSTGNIDADNENLFIFTDAKHPVPLPRAYTTLQAEAIKGFGDKMYGYYTHEKKSLWQSTLLGSIFMLMNTYWSSKKNQWIGKGGIYTQGKLTQYEENKKDTEGNLLYILADGSESTTLTKNLAKQKYWCKLDENGMPTLEPTTDPSSGIPFMVWQGKYEEGILNTLVTLIKSITNPNLTFKLGFDAIWDNDDPNLRDAYRYNLKQLWTDILITILLGSIICPALTEATKKHCKDVGNTNAVDAFTNACKLESVSMLKASVDDFNGLNSVLGRGIDWTPFAISSMVRQYLNWSSVFFGKKDFEDALVKTYSATRTMEPMFDYVKLGVRGREIGETEE